VEDQEALETSAGIGELADALEDRVDELLTDGVVTTSIVVGSILLSADELLGVEQAAVGTAADLIDDGLLEIDEDGARDVLAGTSLGEEGAGGGVELGRLLVRGNGTIGGDTVLEAVKLPTGVTNLDTGLTDVDGNNFTHV